MHVSRLSLLIVSSSLTASALHAAGGVLTSVEAFRDQFGSGSVALREYLAYDEAFDVPGLKSMTVSVNGAAPLVALENPTYGNQVKRRESFGSDQAAMLAARPIDGAYAFELFDSVGGSLGARTIQGPSGVSFAQGMPSAPLFSFLRGSSGSTTLSGAWAMQAGRPVFRFNPAGLTSFRVVMSDVTLATTGDLFEYRYAAANVTHGQVNTDAGGDWGPTTGPGAIDYNGVVFTYFLGAPPAAGDVDPTTYGFVTGHTYQIEGTVYNHFNVDETADLYSAFVFGATTSVRFQAIPEPSAWAQIAGVLALFGAGARRRRR